MASINYAAREISVKVVYYGPGLSGKLPIYKHTPKVPWFKANMSLWHGNRSYSVLFLPLDWGKSKVLPQNFSSIPYQELSLL